MSDRYAVIKISDIDHNDQRYQISSQGADTAALAESIRRVGLMHPVWLRPFNDRFIIISGFNRVKAVASNKEDTIAAFVTDNSTSDLDCRLKAISAKAHKRPLTPAELIKAIHCLEGLLDVGQISSLGHPVFCTDLSKNYVAGLLEIKRKLPSHAALLMETGHLTIKAAIRLSRLPAEYIPPFLHLLSKIKASASIQSEVIQNLYEICRRDNILASAFLKLPQVLQILDSEKTDMVLKTRAVRDLLYQMRFPALSQSRAKRNLHIKSLKLDKAIALETSDNFEDPRIRVCLTAGNYDEFLHALKSLDESSRKDAFKTVFDTP